MTECRPELIFVEDYGSGSDTDALPDFTIHVSTILGRDSTS